MTLACAALTAASLLYCSGVPTGAFDGADEADPARNLIKGRGGAMFMEKVLMHSSPRNFILVDPSKRVTKLGEKFPIPVEVLPVTLRLVEFELKAIGAVEIVMRLAVGKDGPVITENGNLILDVRFADIHETLERDTAAVPGVIESGLFWGRDVPPAPSVPTYPDPHRSAPPLAAETVRGPSGTEPACRPNHSLAARGCSRGTG